MIVTKRPFTDQPLVVTMLAMSILANVYVSNVYKWMTFAIVITYCCVSQTRMINLFQTDLKKDYNYTTVYMEMSIVAGFLVEASHLQDMWL